MVILANSASDKDQVRDLTARAIRLGTEKEGDSILKPISSVRDSACISSCHFIKTRFLLVRLLLVLPFIFVVAGASCGDISQEGIEGRWTLSHRKPGVVDVETVELKVTRGEGHSVTAEVSIPGVIVPFEGTFDPETGELSLIAYKGSESATINLKLKDGQLNGEGDLPIGQLTFEGRRATGSAKTPVKMEFVGPRPSEFLRGDLPPALEKACKKIIEKTMKERDVVGLSMALIADNKVIDVLSSGWQDFEKDIHATARTMYRWASVTKPMTAIAALQLVASGDLDLNADVRKYVPEFDKGVVISVRDLLAHKSGIPHSTQTTVRTVKEYDDPHPFVDRIASLDMFVESDLIFKPGSAHSYSTPGYVLLGAVIERAGRSPYAEQVMKRICQPLGMESMRPDYIWEEVSNRNVPYQHTDIGPLPTQWDDISWKLPAGGWLSTVEDMGRFAIGLMGTELLDGALRSSMRSMHTDYGDGVKGYGLGINVAKYDGNPVLYHAGGQVGASSFLVCAIESGHAVAIMTNTEGIGLSDLAFQALDHLMDKVPSSVKSSR